MSLIQFQPLVMQCSLVEWQSLGIVSSFVIGIDVDTLIFDSELFAYRVAFNFAITGSVF